MTDKLPVEKIRETYYEASGKVSDIARQLAFAGIGMVWILSGSSMTASRQLDIDNDLLWAGLVLVVALALDLLQYSYRTLAWGTYGRYLERKNIQEISPPAWINRPALTLFALKLLAVGLAYVLLIIAVTSRLD